MQEIFEKIRERVEAIDCDYKWCEDCCDCYREQTIQKAIEIVNQVAEEYKSTEHINSSTYTSTDKWIPCSERLPENSDIHEVTARFVNGKCYTEFAYYDLIREEWWKHDDDGLVNVIAWKKPSAPYQPKGE